MSNPPVKKSFASMAAASPAPAVPAAAPKTTGGSTAKAAPASASQSKPIPSPQSAPKGPPQDSNAGKSYASMIAKPAAPLPQPPAKSQATLKGPATAPAPPKAHQTSRRAESLRDSKDAGHQKEDPARDASENCYYFNIAGGCRNYHCPKLHIDDPQLRAKGSKGLATPAETAAIREKIFLLPSPCLPGGSIAFVPSAHFYRRAKGRCPQYSLDYFFGEGFIGKFVCEDFRTVNTGILVERDVIFDDAESKSYVTVGYLNDHMIGTIVSRSGGKQVQLQESRRIVEGLGSFELGVTMIAEETNPRDDPKKSNFVNPEEFGQFSRLLAILEDKDLSEEQILGSLREALEQLRGTADPTSFATIVNASKIEVHQRFHTKQLTEETVSLIGNISIKSGAKFEEKLEESIERKAVLTHRVSLLSQAISFGYLSLIPLLIEFGANPFYQDNQHRKNILATQFESDGQRAMQLERILHRFPSLDEYYCAVLSTVADSLTTVYAQRLSLSPEPSTASSSSSSSAARPWSVAILSALALDQAHQSLEEFLKGNSQHWSTREELRRMIQFFMVNTLHEVDQYVLLHHVLFHPQVRALLRTMTLVISWGTRMNIVNKYHESFEFIVDDYFQLFPSADPACSSFVDFLRRSFPEDEDFYRWLLVNLQEANEAMMSRRLHFFNCYLDDYQATKEKWVRENSPQLRKACRFCRQQKHSHLLVCEKMEKLLQSPALVRVTIPAGKKEQYLSPELKSKFYSKEDKPLTLENGREITQNNKETPEILLQHFQKYIGHRNPELMERLLSFVDF